jgi:hypothetical protein
MSSTPVSIASRTNCCLDSGGNPLGDGLISCRDCRRHIEGGGYGNFPFVDALEQLGEAGGKIVALDLVDGKIGAGASGPPASLNRCAAINPSVPSTSGKWVLLYQSLNSSSRPSTGRVRTIMLNLGIGMSPSGVVRDRTAAYILAAIS